MILCCSYRMLSAINATASTPDGELSLVPDVQAAYKAGDPTKRAKKLQEAKHDILMAGLQAQAQSGPFSTPPQVIDLAIAHFCLESNTQGRHQNMTVPG